MKQMYGLFLCTYDHYEWKDLVLISKSVDKLSKCTSSVPIIHDYDTHVEYASGQVEHYYIDKVNYI